MRKRMGKEGQEEKEDEEEFSSSPAFVGTHLSVQPLLAKAAALVIQDTEEQKRRTGRDKGY